MKLSILIPAALAGALTACAGVDTDSFGLTPNPGPAIINAGQQSVIIGPVKHANDSRAETLAIAHCQQYRLTARLPRMIDDDKVHYMCVQ